MVELIIIGFFSIIMFIGVVLAASTSPLHRARYARMPAPRVITHGDGPMPFKQRPNGTWYDPKTGKDCEVLTLQELMEKYK